MKYNQYKGSTISNLTLGTAQLGIDYGVANKEGKPSKETVLKILEYASKEGVNSFDTAPSYGNSEEILGSFIHKIGFTEEPFLITKIPKIRYPDLSTKEIDIVIRNSVTNSMKRLNTTQITGCLLHEPEDMTDVVIDSLSKIKNEGLVKFIGVSIYTPNDVKKFLTFKELDVIQVPLNVLDTRLIHLNIKELKKKNVAIFARSIFLQGLLHLKPINLPKYLQMEKKYLEKLHLISSHYNISIPQLALTFVRDIPGVTSLVVGCESLSQLRMNLELLESPPLDQRIRDEIVKEFSDVPEKIINPSLWNN